MDQDMRTPDIGGQIRDAAIAARPAIERTGEALRAFAAGFERAEVTEDTRDG